jgi:type II secretory pathway pseudopilin PulG
MKNYKIGLAIICALVLGLTIYTLVLGVNSKQDIATDKKAQEIATKLNDYITNNQRIPKKISEVGVNDVPAAISYNYKSNTEYEFCVTYKAASQGYNSGISDVLTSPLTSRLYGTTSSGDQEISANSTYKPSSLYFYGGHKKGANCQTVKPYIYGSGYNYDYSPPSSSSSTNAKDVERQTDIKSLYAQIEAYYAQNGKYPTLANLNDSTWLSTNMKGLDSGALRDPSGTSSKILAKPASGSYSYDVQASDGAACDNVSKDCTYYTLTAKLSSGISYSKYNLN